MAPLELKTPTSFVAPEEFQTLTGGGGAGGILQLVSASKPSMGVGLGGGEMSDDDVNPFLEFEKMSQEN